MNVIQSLISNVDATALAISFGLFSIYIGVYLSLFESVGDLEQIQRRALLDIAMELEGFDFFELFKRARSKSRALLEAPTRENKVLKLYLLAFLGASLVNVFYKSFEMFVFFMPPKEYIVVIYFTTLLVAAYYVWKEAKYFLEYRRLERDHPAYVGPSSRTIVIKIEDE
jgi:hypothetical protein